MRDPRADLLLEQIEQRADREGWFAPMRQALAGVTAAEAAWVPAPGCNSIWQLVNHLTFWSAWLLGRLEGERPTGREIDNAATFGPPGDPGDVAGWARAVAELFDVYGRLAATVAGLGEGALERPLNSRGDPCRLAPCRRPSARRLPPRSDRAHPQAAGLLESRCLILRAG